MTPESANNRLPASTPTGTSAGEAGDNRQSTPGANAADPGRTWTSYGLALLACLALFSVLRWWWYPNSVERYYHPSVIQGLQQAGGLPDWAFWESAPLGRAHIHPPALHVLGYVVSWVGISPVTFMTFISWLLYPLSLLTSWYWVRKLFGPRPALITVMLLSTSTAVFWNQTAFNANALAMTIAPLALLALESEKYLACAVLNLLAVTSHPLALFLPPALLVNTVARRKNLLAGLLAAVVPVLLYAPWLIHVLANRTCLPGQWYDQDLLFAGADAGASLSIGTVLALAAYLGLGGMLFRRREALIFLGPLLGFALVFPMGFGVHLIQYNLPWLLACLGGYGGELFLEWLEFRLARWLSAVRIALKILAFLVLATWVAVEIPLPEKLSIPAVAPAPLQAVYLVDPERAPPAQPLHPPTPPPETPVPTAKFTVTLSALTMLLEPYGYMPPVGKITISPTEMARSRKIQRQEQAPRWMPGGGTSGLDAAQQDDAREFFEAITKTVAVGEVIYLLDGPGASVITAYTGRWTTGTTLRNSRPAKVRALPAACKYMVTLGPGSGGMKPPKNFSKVFGNPYGTLYRNPASLPANPPVKALIPARNLAILIGLGICLVLFDLQWPRERNRDRVTFALVTLFMAAVCLAPLARSAADELLSSPKDHRVFRLK
ncbi:MAG: hypothetical protein WCO56_17045 [Verrucomicrobiota bacterium]